MDNPDLNKSADDASLAGDGPVTITFEQLYYSVKIPVRKLGLWEKVKGLSLQGFPSVEYESKFLLSNISGTIKPNTMTALMGPSGAGKSTLLDVLSKRKNAGTIEGSLLANGVEPDVAYKRMVGYVEQRDILLPTLTPKEIFYYTALLRLPRSVSEAYVNERVKQVIEELSLQSCQDNMIGGAALRGISGGQAKRVNIGIELITDPRVLFLDEPTTGLDSFTSLEVMNVMRDITNRGRTTICTIHQPSSDVFRLFDRLLLLVKGEIVYLGAAKDATGYFGELGYKHPPKMNPADFLIAVTGAQGPMFDGPDVYEGFFAEKYISSNLQSDRLQSAVKAASHLKQTVLVEEHPQFINNQFVNCWTLTKRFWQTRKRDSAYAGARFGRIIVMIFLISTVFAQQDNDYDAVYNILSVLNFSVMNFGFGALTVLGSLSDERAYFVRERNASALQVSAYYWANLLSEVPVMMVQSMVFALFVYWIVGLRANAGAFFIFFLFLYVLSDTGFGIAQTFAALGSDFEQASALVFPVLILSFLFAGFYVRKSLIPDYWIWAYYTSFIQYALNGVMINQFSGSNDYTNCQNGQNAVNKTDPTCGEWDNDDILAFWGFGSEGALDSVWGNFGVCLAIWAMWRVFGYLALRFKRHGSR